MKPKFSLTIALLIFVSSVFAQQVGIGTNNPDTSAVLDIQSSDKGILIPRLTNNQRDSIYSPVKGLLVFDTDSDNFWFYNGTAWVEIESSGNNLEQAYNKDGPGAGRKINAVNGAVKIEGTDGFYVTGIPNVGAMLDVNGAGTRMFFFPRKSAFRAGNVTGNHWNNDSIGEYSVAMGVNTVAKANYSTAFGSATRATADYTTAFGFDTKANDYYATAFGRSTEALGQYSTAFGYATRATGFYTTAFGSESQAQGFYSTSFGKQTTANAYASTAVGMYNDTIVNPQVFVNSNSPLFIVGNGDNAASLSNAFTVYKNGNVEINDSYVLPATDGNSGDVIVTDGAGNLSWSNSHGTGVFENSANVVRNSGNDSIDDFLFGAPTMDYDGQANHNSKMYFDKSKSAFRAGYISSSIWDTASLGMYSGAFGWNNDASGQASFSAGLGNEASGDYSTAFGQFSEASGNASLVSGYYSSALGSSSLSVGFWSESSGDYSTALGRHVLASGDFSFAQGYLSEATADYSIAMGDSSYATNNYAVSIGSQNVSSGPGSVSLGSQLEASGVGSLALGYNSVSSGALSYSLGYGLTSSGDYSVSIGSFNTASGLFATALSTSSEASGDYASAYGPFSVASGDYSTAFGMNNIASGASASVFGFENIASGDRSTAMGFITKSKGFSSTSMGYRTKANGYASLVIGMFNDTIVATQSAVTNNTPLFIIGNGSGLSSLSNAMVVKKNGNVGIGLNNPSVKLEVSGNIIASGTITSSDFRYKRNINPIENSSALIKQLNPVSYYFKTKEFRNQFDDKLHFGLIAQELEKILPNMVYTNSEGFKSINYTEIVPLLIDSYKELELQIEEQNKKIELLFEMLEAQN